MKLPGLLLAAILPGTLLFGQSLAELADSAKKKRKKSTPVYTDDDLKNRSPEPGASPAAGPGGSTPTQGSEGGGSGGSNSEGGRRGGGEGGGDSGDADSFRADRATRREAIKKAEERIAATQARLSDLSNDLNPTHLSDPFRLQTIEAEKVKAREELAAAEVELKQAKDELADFDEDARKRGVPPSWLREP